MRRDVRAPPTMRRGCVLFMTKFAERQERRIPESRYLTGYIATFGRSRRLACWLARRMLASAPNARHGRGTEAFALAA
jgi:hypothetical protein